MGFYVQLFIPQSFSPNGFACFLKVYKAGVKLFSNFDIFFDQIKQNENMVGDFYEIRTVLVKDFSDFLYRFQDVCTKLY